MSWSGSGLKRLQGRRVATLAMRHAAHGAIDRWRNNLAKDGRKRPIDSTDIHILKTAVRERAVELVGEEVVAQVEVDVRFVKATGALRKVRSLDELNALADASADEIVKATASESLRKGRTQ